MSVLLLKVPLTPLVVLRIPVDQLRLPPERAGWAPEGIMAFSKICTHAGCPVGLYRADTKELYCPCHQSVFEVLEGAKPAGGPATTALPQLPMDVDGEGYLVARSDYTEPVGPGFWNRGHA